MSGSQEETRLKLAVATGLSAEAAPSAYRKDGNSVCEETTWYTDGCVVSKITMSYPDGHSETETRNLVRRCGLAVDPDISNEEFAKLKESMRGIVADEVLDSED